MNYYCSRKIMPKRMGKIFVTLFVKRLFVEELFGEERLVKNSHE